MHAEKPHILIIDDDERIRTLVSKYLWKHEFIAATAKDAEEGLEILNSLEFDALVVDVMMPGASGLEFTESLRQKNNQIPILLLTALGEVEHRITGFEHGADDYLPKPFEPQELVLRLKALLRRTPQPKKIQDVHEVGPWRFIREESLLEAQDRDSIKLTDIEAKLLQALLRHEGEVVSREQLAKFSETEGSERAIDVQVTRLRKKLEEDPSNPKYLKTLRGKGYMLRASSS